MILFTACCSTYCERFITQLLLFVLTLEEHHILYKAFSRLLCPCISVSLCKLSHNRLIDRVYPLLKLLENVTWEKKKNFGKGIYMYALFITVWMNLPKPYFYRRKIVCHLCVLLIVEVSCHCKEGDTCASWFKAFRCVMHHYKYTFPQWLVWVETSLLLIINGLIRRQIHVFQLK